MVFFIMTRVSLSAQPDTLPEVTISHMRTIIGNQQTIAFDSAEKARSAGMTMADMINASGFAYVKQYGPGNISTANLRGGSSYHTTLIWNGLNIANPMLGNADLSLFPSLFADVNLIQFGGNSSLWGSGSVAGSFQLENTSVFKPSLSAMAGAEYSSLHTFTSYGKLNASNEKWNGSVRFFTQNGKNDFSYYNPFTLQTEKLTHAQTNQYAVFGQTAVRINNRHSIHLVSFANHSQRQVGPSLTETISLAHQTDQNLRALAYWKYYATKSMLLVRASVLADRLVFVDSLRRINDDSRSMAMPVEIEWKRDIGQQQTLLVYTGYRPVTVRYPREEELIVQHNFSMVTRWMWQSGNDKFSGQLSARYEKQDNRNPVTATAEIGYDPLKSLHLNIRAASLYRLPTLNDLYWREGGNPLLQPEKGYSLDAGLLFLPVFENRSAGFSIEGRIFYRNVHNWIQWMPDATFWSPRNIDHVASYGSESITRLFTTYHNYTFSLALTTLYTVSQPIEGTHQGRQLVYSPMYSGNIRAEIHTSRWWINYSHFYTGYRYTSGDNYLYLEPFFTAQAETGINIPVKPCILSFSGGVRNILDVAYQSMANRPMPGRWFYLRIQLHFTKK